MTRTHRREAERCCEDGCPNDAAPGRIRCHTHNRRPPERRSQPIAPNGGYPTKFERMLEAMNAFHQVDPCDDEGWRRAKERLRHAARAWVTGRR